MVTSETPIIFPKDTLGVYEKIEESKLKPTKDNTARSMVWNRNFGRTKIERTIQNNNDKAQAVCVAAIEIGADSASSKRQNCNARSRYLLNLADSSILDFL